MKKIVIICLAVETVLVLAMAFFGNYRELQQKNIYLPQIIWRLLLAAPVLFIVFESAISGPAMYKTLMTAALLLVLAADITLIFKFEAGLAVFLLVHVLNTVNFTLLSKRVSLRVLAGAAALLAGFLLYKTTLEPRISEPVMAAALQAYMAVILISFWRALETHEAAGRIFTVMVSAGTFLFFAGDYFVARDVFLKEEYHQIVNNLLYYVPHVLLGLSVVYYNPALAEKQA